MAVIKKKVWPEFFDKIVSGEKKFELRLADFDVKEGDTLVLEEWDPKTKKYMGRRIERKVGYFVKFDLNSFGQENEIKEKGFYVIQLI